MVRRVSHFVSPGGELAAVAVVALVPLTLVERPSAAEATPVVRNQPAASPQKSEPVNEVVVQRSQGARLDYTLVLGGKDGTISSGNFDDRRLELRHDGDERVLWFRRGGKTVRSARLGGDRASRPPLSGR